MEILSEKESKIVNMECDFSDKEAKMLLDYADEHLTEHQLNELKLEWAFIEILKAQVENQSELEEKSDESNKRTETSPS